MTSANVVRPGLVASDWLFVAALGSALALAVDPFEWEIERQAGPGKHLPMMFLLLAWVLGAFGERIFRPHRRLPKVMPCFAPLIALAAFMLAGSLYARIAKDLRETFLPGGLYIFVAPMSAWLLLRCADPRRLLDLYVKMLVAAGVVVTIGLFLNYNVRQVFHELEYLFPPLAVYFAFARRGWRRIAGVAFFLLAAALFKKNTGYLTGLIVVGYLYVYLVLPSWRHHPTVVRAALVLGTLVLATAVGLLAAYLYLNRDRYLPTGNPKFRLDTYFRAWSRFLASPFWGTGFTTPGAERFTVFDTGVARNILPTHSDILDLCANGGAMAVALWAWGLARIGRFAHRSVLSTGRPVRALFEYAHPLACTGIASVLTYAFNPILLQPDKSLLLWATLGLLVGIGLLPQESRQPESVGRSNAGGVGARLNFQGRTLRTRP